MSKIGTSTFDSTTGKPEITVVDTMSISGRFKTEENINCGSFEIATVTGGTDYFTKTVVGAVNTTTGRVAISVYDSAITASQTPLTNVALLGKQCNVKSTTSSYFTGTNGSTTVRELIEHIVFCYYKECFGKTTAGTYSIANTIMNSYRSSFTQYYDGLVATPTPVSLFTSLDVDKDVLVDATVSVPALRTGTTIKYRLNVVYTPSVEGSGLPAISFVLYFDQKSS